MEFCVLSPIAGLERYSTLSKHHLVLPQIRDKRYIEFYQKRKKAGDHIILDNGSYEGQKDWGQLVRCIEEYQPNVVVLPDYYLQEWQKTYHEAMHFLDSYFYVMPNIQWMYVPQSTENDLVGFIEGMFKALQDARITWIGLPRALPTKIVKDISIRSKVAGWIKQHCNVKIHALGMANGNVAELPLLRAAGVYSIDSNSPVWRGWCGYSLVNGRWDDISCVYDHPIHPYDRYHDLILENLEACGVNTSNARSNVRT